jgi:hypothetical protein
VDFDLFNLLCIVVSKSHIENSSCTEFFQTFVNIDGNFVVMLVCFIAESKDLLNGVKIESRLKLCEALICSTFNLSFEFCFPGLIEFYSAEIFRTNGNMIASIHSQYESSHTNCVFVMSLCFSDAILVARRNANFHVNF